MKIMVSFAVLILVVGAFLLYTSKPKETSAPPVSTENLHIHVAASQKHWPDLSALPLEERFVPASPEVIDYIRKDNLKQGFSNQPTRAEVTEERLKLLKAAIREIPEKVKDKAKDKLFGIVLLKDLGGTGYTQVVYDDSGAVVGTFLAFDSVVLDRKANEWATYKENTPFKASPTFNYQVKATIADEKSNNLQNAFQYIFLHELGHVVSLVSDEKNPDGKDLVPPSDRDDFETQKYSFVNFSWIPQNGKWVAKSDQTTYKLRPHIRYYQPEDARMNPEMAVPVYVELESTDFVTLYAGTNVWDDFAETFVTYVHSVMMKKPFKIELKEGQKTVQAFELCYGQPRCAQKEKWMREWLK